MVEPSLESARLSGESSLPSGAGSFEMGNPWSDGNPDELPVHTVTLSAYEIGKYEVTKAEYVEALNWALEQGHLGSYVGGDVVA